MSEEIGSIHYDLDLDDKKFKAGMAGASKEVNNFKQGLDTTVKASKTFAIGLAAITAGAVAFGVSSVKAYNASTEAQTKLRTNLLNVKGATEEHVQSLIKQAAALQAVGVIEDDAIIAGQSQLATFNLQGKTIETLTPKITDMVAQMKGHNATAEDMVTINNLVGKVMTGNAGALTRYGVTLSDSQAKMIQNGDEAERAAMVVEVLGQNYGKVNEALRNTPEGRITALKNSFGDFQELVGQSITTVIDPLVKGFDSWLQGMGGVEGVMAKLTETFQKLQPYIPVIATAVMTALVPAFAAWAVEVIAATWPILALLAVGTALGFAVKALIDHFGGWNNLMIAMQPTMKIIGDVWNVIKMVLEAVWKAVAEQLKPAWEQLMAAIEPILPTLKVIGAIIMGTVVVAFLVLITILGAVISFIAKLLTGIIQMVSGIIQYFQGWILFLQGIFTGDMTKVTEGLKMMWNGIKTFFLGLWNGIIGSTKAFVDTIVGFFVNLYNKLVGHSIIPDLVNGIMNWIKSMPGKVTSALGGLVSAMASPFENAANKIISAMKKAWEWIKKVNPFNRNSPSIVDMVKSGTSVITGEYDKMFSDISSMSMVSAPKLQAGAVAPMATQPIAPTAQGGFNLTINADQILATPGEVRAFAEKIQLELTRINRATGATI